MIQQLANELIFLICDHLPREGDISALARSNRLLYGLLQQQLYLRNTQRSCCSALAWAVSKREHATAQKAVTAWAALLRMKCPGDNVSSIIFWGQKSFLVAAEYGCTDIVQMMTSTGLVDVNWRDLSSGRTALAFAAMSRQSSVVSLLMGTDGIVLDSADDQGHTPLSLATLAGDLATVRLLLRSGRLSPNCADRLELRTPLSWAALRGRLDIVMELMEQEGIDLNCRDVHGWTPLSLACRHGYADTVMQLLKTGEVDVNFQDRVWKRTPLMWASHFGHVDAVRLLLTSPGIIVDAVDIHGHSALSLAAHAGRRCVVDLILNTGQLGQRIEDFACGDLHWAVYNPRSLVNLLPPVWLPQAYNPVRPRVLPSKPDKRHCNKGCIMDTNVR